MITILFIVAILVAGVYLGSKYQVKFKTVGGFNVTYVDSTGTTQTLF